jgi:hypothetical protein
MNCTIAFTPQKICGFRERDVVFDDQKSIDKIPHFNTGKCEINDTFRLNIFCNSEIRL